MFSSLLKPHNQVGRRRQRGRQLRQRRSAPKSALRHLLHPLRNIVVRSVGRLALRDARQAAAAAAAAAPRDPREAHQNHAAAGAGELGLATLPLCAGDTGTRHRERTRAAQSGTAVETNVE
jgi:hypothetical protein